MSIARDKLEEYTVYAEKDYLESGDKEAFYKIMRELGWSNAIIDVTYSNLYSINKHDLKYEE